jgi:hypothetical protein
MCTTTHMCVCVCGAVFNNIIQGQEPIGLPGWQQLCHENIQTRGDKRCKGVGAEEFINVMATHLIPVGRKLHGGKLVYMHDWPGCHASQLVKTLTNML